ncbi:SDR family NAD(P)-dependent oxidoreductase [Martelella lutilitoris]|uniref:SDR family NAD(P)-dependent oxidoreductase n=1 Tax=Martelella lutilitoris TaxID=2583532 RepID=A0A5C4JN03_9HYPH|nr:NAD(P)H-binding protein [Martelella lutilitoris]TNB46710.1 SDR family NAD(P)-dependent oxidoreductase [Martelella lutilitoris]
MLIITGASGQLGRKVVNSLLHHVPAERIGISVRDPETVSDLKAAGVRVRQGDYDDADSLRFAWQGVERLLLVSSNAAATGGDPLKQHATAIAVARELGVERVFYTSQVASSPTSQFPPGRTHAATEKMLADSKLRWTALRHGFYAASALAMNARAFETGELSAPEDGKVAWTTHDDLAAVDAALMAGDAVIDGPTPPLTGSQALDLAELATLAGEILERPVGRTLTSEHEMETRLRNAGLPPGAIAVAMGYYRAARAGEFAAVDGTLAEILGRPPVTMDTFLKANLR